MDPRLTEMPDDLSEAEISAYIREKCNMKDPLYDLVYVLEKRKSGLPTCRCRKCDKLMKSCGPEKIMYHNIPEGSGHKEKGLATTCEKLDPEFRTKAEDALAAKVAEKEKKELEKKRKALAQAAKSAKVAKKKQTSLEAVMLVDFSSAGLDKLWSKAALAAPFAPNLLENEYVIDAIVATSRFMLSEAQKKDLDNAPRYKPPSAYTVLNPQRKSLLVETTANLCALQAIEAAKYGIAATSDGWSSNAQHRPIEAQLFETPTVTLMNEAEDLSGMVKSDVNIAVKLGEWADAGCARMGLPKETNDFICVDGAEIGAINKLITAAPTMA